MKFLKSYINFNEAVAISVIRPYMIEFDRTKYSELFNKMKQKYSGDKGAYRIYIPLVGVIENPIKEEIKKFLLANEFEIIDYSLGTCKRIGAKNQSKIGQVLTRLKNDDLMRKFVSDNSRKSGDLSDLIVCISRHPYDIVGSDTDRNWTNCMTLATPDSKKVLDMERDLAKLKDQYLKDDKESTKDKINSLELKIKGYKEEGQNAYRLIDDVKGGGLISYLIKKDDLNIQNPIANLNIKPYQNTKNKKDIILISDTRMYGQGMEEFRSTVDSFLREVNGNLVDSLYCLKDGLYIDSHSMEYRIINEPKDEKELDKLLKSLGIENYEILDDMQVDVDGDVNLSDKGIKNMPIKFREVKGSFNISVNRLETLENMPIRVGGDFDVSTNLLKSLIGCPNDIGGDLDATKNNIKDTNGIGDVSGKILLDSNVKSIKESVDSDEEEYLIIVYLDITNIPNQNMDIKDDTILLSTKTLADAKKLKKDFLDKGSVDGYKIIDVIIE